MIDYRDIKLIITYIRQTRTRGLGGVKITSIQTAKNIMKRIWEVEGIDGVIRQRNLENSGNQRSRGGRGNIEDEQSKKKIN